MTSCALVRYDSLKTPAQNLAMLKKYEPDDDDAGRVLTHAYVRGLFFVELVRVAEAFATSMLEARRRDMYGRVVEFLACCRDIPLAERSSSERLEEAQDVYALLCKAKARRH